MGERIEVIDVNEREGYPLPPGVYQSTEVTCRWCGEKAPIVRGVVQHRCVIVIE